MKKLILITITLIIGAFSFNILAQCPSKITSVIIPGNNVIETQTRQNTTYYYIASFNTKINGQTPNSVLFYINKNKFKSKPSNKEFANAIVNNASLASSQKGKDQNNKPIVTCFYNIKGQVSPPFNGIIYSVTNSN